MKKLSILLLCLIPAVGCTQTSVDIEIVKGPATNILSAEQPLSLTIRPRSTDRKLPDGLGYVWRDFRGSPLTAVTPIRDGAVEGRFLANAGAVRRVRWPSLPRRAAPCARPAGILNYGTAQRINDLISLLRVMGANSSSNEVRDAAD